VGSNLTQGMDVWYIYIYIYIYLFCVCAVLCLGSGLVTGWSLVQWVLPSVNRPGDWKATRAHKGCRANKKKKKKGYREQSVISIQTQKPFMCVIAVCSGLCSRFCWRRLLHCRGIYFNGVSWRTKSMTVRVFVTLLKFLLDCVTNILIWSHGHCFQETEVTKGL
jgi:hypothetical protein